MKHDSIIRRWSLGLCLTGLALCTSCSAIYDYEGDCEPHYRVEFRYDRNLKFADAFASEVKSVSLYLFDGEGRFVHRFDDSSEALASGSYSMSVDVEPGDYRMVTWAGLKDHPHFSVPELTSGVSTIDELRCTMARTGADGYGIVSEDLNNPQALFNGYTEEQRFPSCEGEHVIPVSLTKNTNNVRVVLQQLSGEDLNAEDFRFRIEAHNGTMNYDNALLTDEPLVYEPWDIRTGEAGTVGGGKLKVAVAEFTMGRLVVEDSPVLTVTDSDGETVAQIPLIDYALLVKGNYRKEMSDQEYLDRQDEYELVLFLDQNYKWDEVHIMINSWALVLDHQTVG